MQTRVLSSIVAILAMHVSAVAFAVTRTIWGIWSLHRRKIR